MPHQPLSKPDIVREMLFGLVPLWIPVWAVDRPLRLRVSLGLVHQIRDPGRDRFHHHLRTFAFQELEHMEVAVAFGDLCPEFPSDLHHRLHFGAVNLDLVHLLGSGIERIR